MVAWSMALHHRSRVRAVASLCTPYYPPARSQRNPATHLKSTSNNRFNYQVYFQTEGVAEKEFEDDVEYTLTCILRSMKPEDINALAGRGLGTSTVTTRGGMLKGFPEKSSLKRSVMLSEADLSYYVKQFQKSGFRGGLNWYRNVSQNWEWNAKLLPEQSVINLPALMITAGRDPVLRPSMTKGMELYVPLLKRGHIESSGHWVQQEEPEQVNRILLKWLKDDVEGCHCCGVQKKKIVESRL